MKKLLYAILVLAMTLTLTACFGRRNDSNNETEPSSTPTSSATEPSMPMPTMETNIPDTNVDDKHMNDFMDDTEDTNPMTDIVPEIKQRITGNP